MEPEICELLVVRRLAILLLVLFGCASPPPPDTRRRHLGVLVDNAELAEGAAGRTDEDRMRARALVGEAAAQREAGELAAAERSAEQALELDPSLPEAHVEWSLAAEGLGRDASLIAAHYQLAARLSPEDARAQVLAAQWAARIGDQDRALDGYTRAIAADPAVAEAYARRGDIYAQRGDHRAAVSDYRLALERDPRFVPALIGLADSAEQLGDHGLAERAHRDLITLYPSASLYRSRIIAFYRRIGDDARASAEERALEKIDPKDTRRLRELKSKKK